MFTFFSAKLLDALVKATHLSLDTLKRRIFVSKSVWGLCAVRILTNLHSHSVVVLEI